MKKAIALIVAVIFCPAWADNLVGNGGFEQAMSGWQEHFNGGVRGKFQIDRHVSHSGKTSFHISNASAFEPQVYCRIYRQLPVQPNTTYLIGVWSKGRGAGKCWIGGGLPSDWNLKRQLPAGDYDWRWTAVEYTTAANQTVFELMILSESPTRDLWIDDVYFAPIDASRSEAIVYEPIVQRGLSPDARFYPALPQARVDATPVLKVRASKTSAFGFDATVCWNANELRFDILTVDAGESSTSKRASAEATRSIRLMLDIQPDTPKESLSSSCYDLEFSWKASGAVVQRMHYAGGVDPAHWPDLEIERRDTPAGTQLTIHLPWKRFRLESAELPRVMGVNIATSENGADASSPRSVSWASGSEDTSSPVPWQFARLIRAEGADRAACVLFDGVAVYDRQDAILGRLVEYAWKAQPSKTIQLTSEASPATPAPAVSRIPCGQIAMAKLAGNSTRSTSFVLPLTTLSREGRYRLLATCDSLSMTEAAFVRTDVRTRVVDLLAVNQAHARRIRDRMQNRPANRYVAMGLAIADRFIARVGGTLSGVPIQSPSWSMRQMNEVGDVLREVEAFIDADLPYDSPQFAGGAVKVRDGMFYAQTSVGERPFYFGGFGHFNLVAQESPTLAKMGFNLIQQECGPSSMSEEGQLDVSVTSRIEGLRRAGENRMKAVFLLSPHYFPEWANRKSPEIVVPNGSFNRFDINHPLARDVIGRWIDAIVGKTKDEPWLLSYDLMNEPVYTQSGRTACSTPLWTAYLAKHHKTLDAMNALYGTRYAAFDDVPVPPAGFPNEIGAQRAYYDWVCFNQENFADWIRFMHDRVKTNAPAALTQVKLMDTILTRSSLNLGIDPERICNITDLAGNDCWSLWPGGTYAYCWTQMALWYDLLHSFRHQPVINTENHVLPDGSGPSDEFPPMHIYAQTWQGAIHHQAAQATWVWEEAGDPLLQGHMSFRPISVYASAKALLDTNRLAKELAALHAASPRVAILYSVASIFWEPDYSECVKAIHPAVLFAGQPVTFVSERQLATGTAPKVDVIVLPHATHVMESTFNALQEFTRNQGVLVAVGAQCLAFDEYHRPRSSKAMPTMAQLSSALSGSALTAALRPCVVESHDAMTLQLTDVTTHQPVWGVEFRHVNADRTVLLSMINTLPTPVTVVIDLKDANTGPWIDLISGRPVDRSQLALEPMVPHLLTFTPTTPPHDR